jgi:hypothetical protein
MNHIPWVILGMALLLFGGWVVVLYNEWDNNRRTMEAKREYQRWRSRQ